MFVFDIISNFFKLFWSKGKAVSRIDFNSYYRKFAYPTPFIEQHKSAPGVSDVFKQLKSAHNTFKEKRAKIYEEESAKENRKFSKWKIFHVIKFISKRSLLIGAFLSIVLGIISSSSEIRIFNDLGITAMTIMLISIPISLISKGVEKILETDYNKYSQRVKDNLIAIRLEYLKIEDVYREEMDKLCLDSLSEQERTAERHHREIVKLEKENAEKLSYLNTQIKKIRRENKQHNEDINEEIDKIKKTMGIDY